MGRPRAIQILKYEKKFLGRYFGDVDKIKIKAAQRASKIAIYRS